MLGQSGMWAGSALLHAMHRGLVYFGATRGSFQGTVGDMRPYRWGTFCKSIYGGIRSQILRAARDLASSSKPK